MEQRRGGARIRDRSHRRVARRAVAPRHRRLGRRRTAIVVVLRWPRAAASCAEWPRLRESAGLAPWVAVGFASAELVFGRKVGSRVRLGQIQWRRIKQSRWCRDCPDPGSVRPSPPDVRADPLRLVGRPARDQGISLGEPSGRWAGAARDHDIASSATHGKGAGCIGYRPNLSATRPSSARDLRSDPPPELRDRFPDPPRRQGIVELTPSAHIDRSTRESCAGRPTVRPTDFRLGPAGHSSWGRPTA